VRSKPQIKMRYREHLLLGLPRVAGYPKLLVVADEQGAFWKKNEHFSDVDIQ
jgi:hypothetical protein